MFTTSRGAQECYLPSWRIEPKYSTKVLIGNWNEERKKFTQYPEKTCKSTYGRDYIRVPTEVPDRTVLRKHKKKLDGLPKQVLLTHHNEPNHRYFVTQYDDNYCRHGYNPLLPPLRKWNRHKVAWIPEKTDFPLAEPPTNYGLFEHHMRKWSLQDQPATNSVYTISYIKPPLSAYAPHCHPFSTHLNSSPEHLRPRTMDGYL